MGLEEVKQQEMAAVAVDPRSTYAQRTAATVPSYGQQLPPGYVYDDEPAKVPYIEGHWSAGICTCLEQCVPTCCAAMYCSWCLVARFYDQFVSRGRYAYVLGAFIVLSVLQGIFYSIRQSSLPYIEYDRDGYDRAVHPGNPTLVLISEYISSMATVAMALLSLYCLVTARGALRRRFRIPGSECDDCCWSFWCHCCVLSQMYRHVHPSDSCCDDMDCEGLCAVPHNQVMNV